MTEDNKGDSTMFEMIGFYDDGQKITVLINADYLCFTRVMIINILYIKIKNVYQNRILTTAFLIFLFFI